MSIAAVSSPATTSYADVVTASSTAGRTAKKALGQNDFLRLLATQFQQQDPMKPMEDSAFIAQMAQFTALEQSNSLVSQVSGLRADQNLLTANGYLGRSVTVEDGDGNSVTGLVTAVDSDPVAGVSLTIAGNPYPLTAVRRIAVAANPPASGVAE
jgi:flagellar basal-body rod modification protein FlgD